jgi:hypothetical protein
MLNIYYKIYFKNVAKIHFGNYKRFNLFHFLKNIK